MKLHVKANLTSRGINIFVNKDKFPIIYPKEIWDRYPANLKQVLLDNLAYSSTLFVPQMKNENIMTFATSRPISETFLYKNGITDMPICAAVDGVSSVEYIKRFFNTQYLFANNAIKTPPQISFKEPKRIRAIVPFSFGKETLLTAALCVELGIEPILVNFIEPSLTHDHWHKKNLVKDFEREFKLKVHFVNNGPGIFRYGAYWKMATELGWGLHTTDYVMMALPFLHYFNASMIVLGNEASCNDIFFDKEGVLTYKAGYDQHSDWTPQQALLGSLLLGRKIKVTSFLNSLYEIAETKILHQRYPEWGKYQMSCESRTLQAKHKRWCQNCLKCSYMFPLTTAFDVNLETVGFDENMFDKKRFHLYKYFFDYNPSNPNYGSQEELGLGFYLSSKRGRNGYSIDIFNKKLRPFFEKNKKRLIKKYLGVNQFHIEDKKIRGKLNSMFRQELKEFL